MPTKAAYDNEALALAEAAAAEAPAASGVVPTIAGAIDASMPFYQDENMSRRPAQHVLTDVMTPLNRYPYLVPQTVTNYRSPISPARQTSSVSAHASQLHQLAARPVSDDESGSDGSDGGGWLVHTHWPVAYPSSAADETGELALYRTEGGLVPSSDDDERVDDTSYNSSRCDSLAQSMATAMATDTAEVSIQPPPPPSSVPANGRAGGFLMSPSLHGRHRLGVGEGGGAGADISAPGAPPAITPPPVTSREKEKQQSTKTGARPSSKMHQCRVCLKTFPRPSGLRTHMNSHSGEKRKFSLLLLFLFCADFRQTIPSLCVF
jgi:hypothetical protein